MQINSTSGSQSSLGLNPPNANRVAAPDAGSTEQTNPAEEFQPTSDILSFMDALGRIPLVREEVVGEVAQRLNGGELLTPQARQQTVESILGTAPGHD